MLGGVPLPVPGDGCGADGAGPGDGAGEAELTGEGGFVALVGFRLMGCGGGITATALAKASMASTNGDTGPTVAPPPARPGTPPWEGKRPLGSKKFGGLFLT